jgi:polyphosphate kinase
MGSADLMPRNLDNRVELIVPVEDEGLRAELDDTLERSLADDTFAWELDGEGNWTRREGRTRSVQAELMDRAVTATLANEADAS